MRVGIDNDTGRLIVDVDDLFEEMNKVFEEMPDEAVVSISDVRRWLLTMQDNLKLTALEND